MFKKLTEHTLWNNERELKHVVLLAQGLEEELLGGSIGAKAFVDVRDICHD